MKCEDCKWWEKKIPERGVCFRYPPKAVNGELGLFPQTKSVSSCGEFKDKEKK
jgi:hypothetical protein